MNNTTADATATTTGGPIGIFPVGTHTLTHLIVYGVLFSLLVSQGLALFAYRKVAVVYEKGAAVLGLLTLFNIAELLGAFFWTAASTPTLCTLRMSLPGIPYLVQLALMAGAVTGMHLNMHRQEQGASPIPIWRVACAFGGSALFFSAASSVMWSLDGSFALRLAEDGTCVSESGSAMIPFVVGYSIFAGLSVIIAVVQLMDKCLERRRLPSLAYSHGILSRLALPLTYWGFTGMTKSSEEEQILRAVMYALMCIWSNYPLVWEPLYFAISREQQQQQQLSTLGPVSGRTPVIIIDAPPAPPPSARTSLESPTTAGSAPPTTRSGGWVPLESKCRTPSPRHAVQLVSWPTAEGGEKLPYEFYSFERFKAEVNGTVMSNWRLAIPWLVERGNCIPTQGMSQETFYTLSFNDFRHRHPRPRVKTFTDRVWDLMIRDKKEEYGIFLFAHSLYQRQCVNQLYLTYMYGHAVRMSNVQIPLRAFQLEVQADQEVVRRHTSDLPMFVGVTLNEALEMNSHFLNAAIPYFSVLIDTFFVFRKGSGCPHMPLRVGALPTFRENVERIQAAYAADLARIRDPGSCDTAEHNRLLSTACALLPVVFTPVVREVDNLLRECAYGQLLQAADAGAL